MKIDTTDLKIIKLLQKDARTPFTAIAKQLGLSTSAVQSRFYKMKKSGLIFGSTILVDRSKLGYYTTIMGIKTVTSKTSEVIPYLKNFKLGCACYVYCYEAIISHYNLFMAIIHKDVLDIHLIKDMVMQHPGVIETNINLIVSHKRNFPALDLRNMINRKV